MKELLKFLSKDKKRLIAAVVLPVLFLVLWKFIPKSFYSFRSPVVAGLFMVCVLAVLTAFDLPLSERAEQIFACLLLLFSPMLSFFLTEFAVNNTIRQKVPLAIPLNYVLYFFVYLLLYVITNRVRAAVNIGVTLFAVIALINSFVLEFRYVPIRTADIFVAGTAAEVMEEYRFLVSARRAAVIIAALGLILISYHCRYKNEKRKMRIVLAVLSLVLLGVGCFWFRDDSFIRAHKLKPHTWDAMDSVREHGALLDFVAGIPMLKIKKPEGYEKEAAKALRDEGADVSAEELHLSTGLRKGEIPDIIVIMNESFSDLTRVGAFETDVPYMDFFYSLKENTVHGFTTVPVYGGQTVCTEFEFLSGFSDAFFPPGTTAFQNYVRNGTFNLGLELKKEGYHTVFLHPYKSKGYNRANAYREMGFDEIHFYEDFTYRDNVRHLISDESDYKELVQRYEELTKEKDHVFMFNVTMQNHGGYDTEDYEATVHIIKPSGNYPKAEQYLSLIRESDRAFSELIRYLETVDRPVLVCMFGDHQPSLEKEFLKSLEKNSPVFGVEKAARQYQTPFVLWANYDLEEKEYENISVNYLNLLILRAAGLPLTEFQNYLAGLYETWPVVNVNGSMKQDGTWVTWEEAEKEEAIRGYKMVQYLELFDR